MYTLLTVLIVFLLVVLQIFTKCTVIITILPFNHATELHDATVSSGIFMFASIIKT